MEDGNSVESRQSNNQSLSNFLSYGKHNFENMSAKLIKEDLYNLGLHPRNIRSLYYNTKMLDLSGQEQFVGILAELVLDMNCILRLAEGIREEAESGVVESGVVDNGLLYDSDEQTINDDLPDTETIEHWFSIIEQNAKDYPNKDELGFHVHPMYGVRYIDYELTDTGSTIYMPFLGLLDEQSGIAFQAFLVRLEYFLTNTLKSSFIQCAQDEVERLKDKRAERKAELTERLFSSEMGVQRVMNDRIAENLDNV